MKVVILGAGQVGYNIARYLAIEDNDVTIVDKSPELLKKISDTLDVQPVVGYASHPDVLEKAGLQNADLLIAVTASDEVNMVACEIANSLFNVDKKIARIRNQSYLDQGWVNLFSPTHLAIDYVISPEVEVAKAINRSIRVLGAFDLISLVTGDLKIIGLRCTQQTQMLNTPLRFLPNLFPKLDFAVASIYRNGKLFVPAGNEKLLIGDEVYLLVHRDKLTQLVEEFSYSDNFGRKLVIMGGGSIGLTLAMEIEKAFENISLMIIEKNPERAEYVARQLTKATVLCGDVLDVEILNEANIAEADTVVSVTEDDKVNILSALLAKKQGAARTMTLLNTIDYSSLVTSLGVDAVISPNAITVSTILQYVRQGQIHSVHSLRDGEVEIIEAEAQETSNVIGLTMEDINIRGKILVAALNRGDQSYILPTKTTVRVGDRIILSVSEDAVNKVERLFTTRPSYL